MLVAPGEAPGYFAETQAYDTEPLSLSEILRLDLHLGAGEEERAVKRSQQMTRSRGIAQTKEHVKWEKKDVVTKGVYKPWFFSRFARFWIPLGKPQCALDLKSISSAARSQSHRQPRNGKECDDDSSDKSGREEEVWVGCDGCSKWRKVPHGFSFDKSKSFFCHMLRDTTCVTPEEEWDDQEEFVDDADRVVDECGSSSTTPRNTHTNYCSQHHAQPQHDCGHPRRMSSCSSTERAAGKRKLVSPRAFGAHDRDGRAPEPALRPLPSAPCAPASVCAAASSPSLVCSASPVQPLGEIARFSSPVEASGEERPLHADTRACYHMRRRLRTLEALAPYAHPRPRQLSRLPVALS
jgi:hypothetical protein